MSFWTGRRVLVTGGAGFLGSRVVAQLKAAGARDIAVPRSKTLNLVDRENCRRAVKNMDIVIHLAAKVGGIGFNRENPGQLFFDNLMMGAQLMEEARLNGVDKFVGIGTVCAYPKFTPVPFHEDDLWNGYPEETNAPYGVAKKSILVGAQGYREQYGLNAIFLLPANMYGPRDNFDTQNAHVIPDLIRKMTESRERVVLWGDGSPSREFLYVDDCAQGLMLAADHYDGREPVNLGTGVETTIRETAELIAELTGFEVDIVWDTSMPNGQPRRSLDTSRARDLFGFEARTPLREGLERTIVWYREHAAAVAGAQA